MTIPVPTSLCMYSSCPHPDLGMGLEGTECFRGEVELEMKPRVTQR